MASKTTSTVEVVLEKAVDTYNHQIQMLPLTMFHEPDPAKLQNAGNVIWQPVQQHAPSIPGWDMTGKETGIIEEAYPAVLGVPDNDIIDVRADDLRDDTYWIRRGEQSGKQRATELNKRLAAAIATQGSLFVRSNATSGYDVIGESQAVMNERQAIDNGRCFMFNDRDNLKYAKDLAARQTLQGRPEDVWAKGQIGQNVAEFDVFTGSFLPNLIGGASPGTTCTGAQSFAPEGGSVNATTLAVLNVDYRTADIVVAASTSYNVGDKVTIGSIQSVGLADKTATGQLMTFSVVGKPDATTLTVFPKPIAFDDAALSTLEKSYANVDTTIANADVVARLNIDATKKTNLFWDKGSVEVLGGAIPAEKFSSFGGMKVISDTLENGLQMYMLYDGDITTATFRMRLFVWYGITVCNPSNCGTLVTF